jgi:hypothetical protein
MPDFVRTTVRIEASQFGNGSSIKLTGRQLKEYPPTLTDNVFNGYPADLFRDADGFGIVQHAVDHSLVTQQNPARRGELVIAYATGMGAVEPPVATGAAALLPAPTVILHFGEAGIEIFMCQSAPSCATRISMTALFAGLSPGNAGVYQINFRIPDNAPTGDVEFGVRRFYCYDPVCSLMWPFADSFESQRVKITVD